MFTPRHRREGGLGAGASATPAPASAPGGVYLGAPVCSAAAACTRGAAHPATSDAGTGPDGGGDPDRPVVEQFAGEAAWPWDRAEGAEHHDGRTRLSSSV
ncbi:MAG: hypothetical protein U5R31_06575 [Acidimicrobiia bacterium]|nr:hypothetical protein [Acidimicrobiia bacterium]